MNNRRGTGEAVMFFPFAFIIVVIIIGLVIGLGSFYGGEYDFRALESQILAERVLNCFNNQSNDFFSQGFVIAKTCHLNQEVIENEHLIYFKRADDNSTLMTGIGDYVQQCSFVGAQRNRNYPRCVNGTVIKNNAEFYYVIGSNQRAMRSIS